MPAKNVPVNAGPVVDPWDTPKETWEYITIPAENALGYRHDAISNNAHKFEPGQSYLVPKLVAQDVNERLRVYARAVVRTLQPRRDVNSENQVAVGTSSSARAIDPSTIG